MLSPSSIDIIIILLLKENRNKKEKTVISIAIKGANFDICKEKKIKIKDEYAVTPMVPQVIVTLRKI